LFLLSFFLAIPAFAADKPGLFTELGFKGKRTISQQIYEESVNRASLTNGIGKFMLATDQACRAGAEKIGKSANQIGSLSGAWLEFSTLVALHDRKLTPAYYQAELSAVPDAIYDVMLWSKEHGPIVLSCKTSLRERYKQADLEAVALRKAYPKSKSFLVTLDADKKHVANCRAKIASKEIEALDAIYDETNMDELFAWLAKQTIVSIPDDVKVKRARAVR
jgi:hypothetical protein